MDLNINTLLQSLLTEGVQSTQNTQTSNTTAPKVFETDSFIDSIFEADADEDNMASKDELSNNYSNLQYQLMILNFQKMFNPNDPELQEKIDNCKEKVDVLTVVGYHFDTFSKNGTEDKIDADDVAAIRASAETDGDGDNFTVEDFETLKGVQEFDPVNTNALIGSIIGSDLNNSGTVSQEEISYKAQQLESQISYLELFNQFFGGIYDDKVEALQEQLSILNVLNENFTALSKEGIANELDGADIVAIINAAGSDSDAADFSMDDLQSFGATI